MPRSSSTSRIQTFWQADKVKVDELDYPVVNSNDTALLKMASHQADWTGIFDPALQSAFVQKDSAHNHVYTVPVVPVQIMPNLKNPLLAQLPCARPSARRSTARRCPPLERLAWSSPRVPLG